ncbi:hypothetical protein PGTUg99_010908 [Puccinia graminis f. sp. tritici]|uniref:Uncharacterized protein n=1 Tax=Puccinia graminis f. sp. tritici TaxID=56615 RepID=A0A5B0M819_PUCGR|nr:hypothetical protein PGTUg99_010908 [Puccinia graminis f. sp. tritici]
MAGGPGSCARQGGKMTNDVIPCEQHPVLDFPPDHHHHLIHFTPHSRRDVYHLSTSVGPGLSWPEIIRKYLKHNPERALTAEIATTELALRLLLASADQEAVYDHDRVHLEDDPDSGHSLLPPLVRTEDKEAAQQHVAKLTASLAKHNTNEADHKLQSEQNAANIVISLGLYMSGEHEKCLQTIQKCTFVVPETVDLNFDKYDVIILVIGLAVKGKPWVSQVNLIDSS